MISINDVKTKIIDLFRLYYKDSYTEGRRDRFFGMNAEGICEILKSIGYEVELEHVALALEESVPLLIREGIGAYSCYVICPSLATEFDLSFYGTHLSKLDSAKTPHHKGKILEATIEDMILLIDGLAIAGKNIRTKVEEIDIMVRNNSNKPFLVQFGDPFLMECKNWSKPVGKKGIVVFIDMLRSKNIRFGILVALKGITGKENSGAMRKILEARLDGITVIVLDRNDLEDIAKGRDPITVLRSKHDEMLRY